MGIESGTATLEAPAPEEQGKAWDGNTLYEQSNFEGREVTAPTIYGTSKELHDAIMSSKNESGEVDYSKISENGRFRNAVNPLIQESDEDYDGRLRDIFGKSDYIGDLAQVMGSEYDVRRLALQRGGLLQKKVEAYFHPIEESGPVAEAMPDVEPDEAASTEVETNKSEKLGQLEGLAKLMDVQRDWIDNPDKYEVVQNPDGSLTIKIKV